MSNNFKRNDMVTIKNDNVEFRVRFLNISPIDFKYVCFHNGKIVRFDSSMVNYTALKDDVSTPRFWVKMDSNHSEKFSLSKLEKNFINKFEKMKKSNPELSGFEFYDFINSSSAYIVDKDNIDIKHIVNF